ncbi:HK97 family phage prohead protease [Schinkia azotoformans]|uniref:HK97 family phage prohead protease n=1 Tax=Schinkia azotoformans TaxID=1454 RepID=UPI002E226656|nr:HK97 family phage prohead protease [Schinkia azotoformans]MED4354077.1 HK97 family phage prohead protease [Schinkia azotoformans]
MKIEIRNDSVKLEGYVNAVERFSRQIPSIRGKFIEQIVPKTFERALSKGNDVELRFNHRPDRVLGSMKQGNLTLYEDNIGLRAQCIVTDQEVIELAKKAELRGWSFGFVATKDRWEDGDGIQKRYIEDMDLLEVSLLSVTPAYVGTSVESRNGETYIIESRNEEFNATVEDLTEQIKEDREEPKPIDYSLIEQEIEYFKLKQRGC